LPPDFAAVQFAADMNHATALVPAGAEQAEERGKASRYGYCARCRRRQHEAPYALRIAMRDFCCHRMRISLPQSHPAANARPDETVREAIGDDAHSLAAECSVRLAPSQHAQAYVDQPLRNDWIRVSVSSGCSLWGEWPQRGRRTPWAPGTLATIDSTCASVAYSSS